MMKWLKEPRNRIYGAWFLFVTSLLGWPLSALWLAKEEPPFVLGLSWLAITLTSLDILASTDIRDKTDKGD